MAQDSIHRARTGLKIAKFTIVGLICAISMLMYQWNNAGLNQQVSDGRFGTWLEKQRSDGKFVIAETGLVQTRKLLEVLFTGNASKCTGYA